MKNKLFLIISTLLLSPLFAGATLIYTSTGGNMYFDIEPKNPGSFTDTKITVTNTGLDPDSAYFKWFLDEKIEKEGLGAKQFTFRTGGRGKSMKIRVLAKTEAREIEKIMILNPADADIIWEADTYTPPFYRGKALPTAGCNVKLIAVPQLVSENGTIFPADELNYEWRVDNNIISSGLGKKSAKMKIETPYSRNTVTVKVSNIKGDITAEKTIMVTPSEPITLFYEENPVEGTLFNRALSATENFYKQEFSIRAEPLFFSYPNMPFEKNLEYRWSLNGKGLTPNEGTPKIITLRNESGEDMLSSLQLSIRNLQKVFQKTITSMTIKSSPGGGFQF